MIIEWAAEAEADKDRIWLFNADRSIGRADVAEARVLDRVAGLASLPYQGRLINRSQRELTIADQQLIVRYRVDEDAVRIMRVFHSRQHRELP